MGPSGPVEFERIEAFSDPMRELIEDLWPELVAVLRLAGPLGPNMGRQLPRRLGRCLID